MIRRSSTRAALIALALVCSGAAYAGEGVVALQTAALACAPEGSVDIYYPCDNGTVTDARTGLVWLANANCFGQVTWHDAMDIVAGLGDLPFGACTGAFSEDQCDCGLRDGSSPGEWRLPTLSEWQTMIELTESMDCEVAITNDLGTYCWVEDCYDLGLCSFYNIEPWHYWSASPSGKDIDDAWFMHLGQGVFNTSIKANPLRVWPVRGGQ